MQVQLHEAIGIGVGGVERLHEAAALDAAEQCKLLQCAVARCCNAQLQAVTMRSYTGLLEMLQNSCMRQWHRRRCG